MNFTLSVRIGGPSSPAASRALRTVTLVLDKDGVTQVNEELLAAGVLSIHFPPNAEH